jgi:Tfp pilus assembly protein PilO
MKTSRKYIIILIIVIFIAAFAFLYMTYNKQKNENTLAQQNLTNAQTTYNTALKNKAAQEELLTETNTQIAELQSRLLLAQQQLQTEQQVIPQAIKNIDYDELLFSLAGSGGLTVLNLSVTGPAESQVNDVTMFMYTFNLSLRGETWDIINFIDKIATDASFISTVIEGVTMTVNVEEVEVDEDTTIEVRTTQGDITLSIYGLEEE